MAVMKKILESLVERAFESLGMAAPEFVVEHPTDVALGDYSTNAALVGAKSLGKNPKELADELIKYFRENKPEDVERVDVAGPGFINFYLKKEFFVKSIKEIIEKDGNFGRNEDLQGEKTIVEYTDPNPFKEFHIGHLMSNTIGEALSRIIEWNGAEVKRACYQGDVGVHVAQAIWALNKGEKEDPYAVGAKAYNESEEAKGEIVEINKKLYSKEDIELNKLYEAGKQASLEKFSKMYERLGTNFDFFFFESETAPVGKALVDENTGTIFEISEGAVVFKGEKYDPKLHTRVFINKDGLPTYEAKELGLAKAKFDKYPYERSIVVTANEVDEYFRVLLAAMKQVLPDLADTTDHISHGMMRLPTGKMSSRTGDVITGDEMLENISKAIAAQGKEPQDAIAVAGLKYQILKQSPGNDIIYDEKQAVSTEGDSGPYLQYTYVRAKSVIEKNPIKNDFKNLDNANVGEDVHFLEKLLYRFPEVVERAGEDFAPQYIVTYLIELASAFNNFYAHNQIINVDDVATSNYRLALTNSVATVLKNGLTVLGIPLVEKM